MTNEELITKIKSEIERRKNDAETLRERNICIDILYFLDTIESEKPTIPGERIGSYNIVPYIDDKIAKLQDMWREEKVSFDWDDLKDMIEDVARHFALWGAEHLK